MAVLEKPRPDVEAMFLSPGQMDELRELVARQFEELGIDYDPTATAEDVRRLMRAEGIRAEDNEFSRAIIAAREE